MANDLEYVRDRADRVPERIASVIGAWAKAFAWAVLWMLLIAAASAAAYLGLRSIWWFSQLVIRTLSI